MKTTSWKSYIPWILLSEATGALSGFLTRDGVQVFQETVAKPPLSPPGLVFPIVWSILYALMGIGAARVSLAAESAGQKRGLLLFLAQLIVNFFWSPIFFNAQAYGAALLWLLFLWVLVLLMTLQFRTVDRTAALLQVPYLLWLTFAAYLNIGVWLLNP